jgi:hypothetical protein
MKEGQKGSRKGSRRLHRSEGSSLAALTMEGRKKSEMMMKL